MNTTLAALALAFLLPAPVADIAWQPSLDAALGRARSEKKVVFVAVNMDGEGANDRMAKLIYKDKDIVALAESTVNVIASLPEHAAAGKPCTRFAGIECAVHQACDRAVRAKVLKPDPSGNVVAPQHVFIDGDGKPLLSVPYEVTAGELAWCFVTATKRADPTSKIAMPGNAHKPGRVVIGGVYDPSGGVGGAIQPITKTELAELIKRVKSGLETETHQAAFWRILHSDSQDAMDFIQAELRDSGGTKHAEILHAMGAVSPSAYWEMAVDFLDANDEQLRLESAAALEQLGAAQAVKAIEKALSKEKKPEVEKDLVRAWAACGARDPKVRAALTKRVRSEKNEIVRTCSIVALGLVHADEDVKACIQEQLSSKDEARQAAGALAGALTRDDAWIPALEALVASQNAETADAAKRALEILRGGSMQRLQMAVWAICKDKVARERTFGKSAG